MAAPLPMTNGRRVALAVGLPFALIAIFWSGLTMVAWAGQGSYPVRLTVPSPGGTVQLDASDGRLDVSPGSGDRVQVTGTAHYAIFRSVVGWHPTSSGIRVYAHCRQPTGPCSADLSVTLPAAEGVVASVDSGDLIVHDLGGNLTLTAGSGEIRGSALAGDMDLTDSSGDVVLTGLTSQKVSATVDSGSVTLRFAAVPDRVEVTVASGDVHLVLPPGETAYDVSATVGSGASVIGVPTDPTSGHVITATVGSGNITVSRQSG